KNWLIFTVKRWVYIWLNKRVVKKSKLLITPTEFVKNDVENFTGVSPKKITVTLESADKITDEPEPNEELRNSRFIMYVGRPTPHKNLRRLIVAFSELQKEHADLHLVFVGKEDENSDEHKRFIEKEKIRNTLYTGFVSEGSLRWLYENTACYCFPSLSEGFGLPGLEAQIHGAPVAASDATCIPEVLGDGAHYFDGLDEGDMKDKIAEVVSDEKLSKKLVANGSKNAERFSWHRMAKQTLEVFDQALKD
ncbi:MAG: glycosyltransferase family 4 protein, partial [bacterium]|nr:glycosyltransferase family 4 protein [bacterium]